MDRLALSDMVTDYDENSIVRYSISILHDNKHSINYSERESIIGIVDGNNTHNYTSTNNSIFGPSETPGFDQKIIPQGRDIGEVIINKDGSIYEKNNQETIQPSEHEINKPHVVYKNEEKNVLLEYHKEYRTFMYRIPHFINSKPLDFIKKSANKKYKISIETNLYDHVFDAINISTHNTSINFNRDGKISSRSKVYLDRAKKILKKKEVHADCIQIIPKYQFYGGLLNNIFIRGKRKNKNDFYSDYDIDIYNDKDHQGIFCSDGRIVNLKLKNLKIITYHPYAINICGMLSGEISNIILEGNSIINILPVRIGGPANIFLASMQSNNKYNAVYKKINQKSNYLLNGNIYEEYYLNDYRNLENKNIKEKFSEKFRYSNIYTNFPIDNFLLHALSNASKYPITGKKKDIDIFTKNVKSFIRKFNNDRSNNRKIGELK